MPRKKIKKLKPGEKRYLRYINRYGVEVELPEELADSLHFQMKEFLGDQVGDKTPPRGALQPGQQKRDTTWMIGQGSKEMTRDEFLMEIERKRNGG